MQLRLLLLALGDNLRLEDNMGRWIVFLVLALLFCPIILALLVTGMMVAEGVILIVFSLAYIWWVAPRWGELVPVQRSLAVLVPLLALFIGLFLILSGAGVL